MIETIASGMVGRRAEFVAVIVLFPLIETRFERIGASRPSVNTPLFDACCRESLAGRLFLFGYYRPRRWRG
jgi:hypothetical protein